VTKDAIIRYHLYTVQSGGNRPAVPQCLRCQKLRRRALLTDDCQPTIEQQQAGVANNRARENVCRYAEEADRCAKRAAFLLNDDPTRDAYLRVAVAMLERSLVWRRFKPAMFLTQLDDRPRENEN
jgi:hypothetical protein